MIVTSAKSHMGSISLQTEHQKIALQLARKFSSDQIQELKPRAFLEYICGNLVSGWSSVDFLTPFNSSAGFPQDFRLLSFELISQAWEKTINQLETYHPFCGLLTSMLYCELCVKAAAHWEASIVDRFTDLEKKRQNKLKQTLEVEFVTSQYTGNSLLRVALEQLKFFYKLAFQLITDSSKTCIYRVPRTLDTSQTIHLEKTGPSRYCMSPFPFIGNRVDVCIRRFNFPALPHVQSLDYRNILYELEQRVDTYQIVR